MVTIQYMVSTPTPLDFLKTLLFQVLDIEHYGRRSVSEAEKARVEGLKSDSVEGTKLLLYRMSIYLAKMAMHSYAFSEILPSQLAIGALFISLKLSEQLKKSALICDSLLIRLYDAGKTTETELLTFAEKMLTLA